MALPSGAIQGLPSPADMDAYKSVRNAREIVATSVQSRVERMPSEESTEVRLLAGNYFQFFTFANCACMQRCWRFILLAKREHGMLIV